MSTTRIPITEAYANANARKREAARLATGLTDHHIRGLSTHTTAPWVLRAIANAIGLPLEPRENHEHH